MRNAPPPKSPIVNKTTEHGLLKFSRWLVNLGPTVINTLGSVGLSIFGIVIGIVSISNNTFQFVPWGIVIAVLIVCNLAGSIILAFREPRLLKLQEDLRTIKDRSKSSDEARAQLAEDAVNTYREIISELVIQVAKSLNLTDCERISVYKNQDNAFFMLGRYSENPKYNGQGRRAYVETEGCIGHAYLHGEAFYDDAPNPNNRKGQTYCNYMLQNWNLTLKVCNELTMRPRNMVACALYNQGRDRRIGVIVFESINIGRFTLDQIRQALQLAEVATISRLIEKMRILKTDINKAEEEGF